MNEGLEKENKQVIRQLLLPLARSLATNWTFGNRREAGVALAHITGSGQDAASLVSTLSKLLKKVSRISSRVFLSDFYTCQNSKFPILFFHRWNQFVS